jgi:hypothetical protein
MKVYFILLTLICSFYYCPAQAKPSPHVQFDTSRDSAYYNTYNRLKELFVKKILSSDYQAAQQMLIVYRDKLRSKGNFDTSLIAKYPGGLNWLKTNWQKTDFASYEEAKEMLEAATKLMSKPTDENLEYNTFNFLAISKYGPQIFLDMYLEVKLEYPDKI